MILKADQNHPAGHAVIVTLLIVFARSGFAAYW
jgi:hypothetical protein